MKLPWKRYKKRGAGILTVLVASTLLLLLAFTVAGTSFHHLSVSNRLHNAQSARNLAEAAIAEAIARLMKDHTQFQTPNPLGPSLEIANTDSPRAGILTFDPTQLPTYNAALKTVRLEASVNNFGSDSALTVYGRTLPPESAYLRAVGVDHGVERAMECIIYIPTFPWSVASGGPVVISGQSTVAGVQDIADAGDPSKELPGHLVTNSLAGTSALVLQGTQVRVTGDAQSSSGADFGTNLVRGERRLNSSAAPIPEIKIEDYDTSTQPGVTTYSSSSAPPDVTGFAYRDGALNFSSGINLQGGVLYVKGDVTITGQIKGEGAIVSTGKVTVNGGGQVATNNKVAMLSRGDLTLHGTSSDRLTVAGIVYTEGKLQSEYVNIYGNTVGPGSAGMDLKDTDLVQTSGSTAMTITTSTGVPPTYNFPQTPVNAIPMNIPGHGTQPIVLGIKTGISAPKSRFLDTGTNKYSVTRIMTGGTPKDQYGNALPDGEYASTAGYEVAAPPPSPTKPAPVSPNDLSLYPDGSTSLGTTPLDYSAGDPMPQIKVQALEKLRAYVAGQGWTPLTPAEEATALADPLFNTFLTGFFAPSNIVARCSQDTIKSASVQINGQSPGGSGPSVTFDLYGDTHMNRMIARAEKIRVLYWRDVLP